MRQCKARLPDELWLSKYRTKPPLQSTLRRFPPQQKGPKQKRRELDESLQRAADRLMQKLKAQILATIGENDGN